MRSFVNLILIPMVCVFTVSCAFNETPSDPNRRRNLQDRQKLIDAYSAIQGVYEGVYEIAGGATEKAELIVSYREQVVGKNQDGENIYQPLLRAKFSRPDSTLDDTRMEAAYIPETGDLTMTTQAVSSNGGGAVYDGEYYYIRGYLGSDGNLTAPVKSASGSLMGTLRISKKSSEVVAPPNGEDLEEYEEFKARLQKFVGQYRGRVTPPRGGRNSEPFDLDIELRIVDDFDGARKLRPTLVSFSRRSDGFSRSGRHKVTYINDRQKDELIFVPAENATGYEAFSLSSIWTGKSFKGLISFPTFSGDFEAKRVTP